MSDATTTTVTNREGTIMTDTTETIKAGVTEAELTVLKNHDQVNMRQSDGVDTLGVYFELDHDRYGTDEISHTLRVLWVAGYPITQYKAASARSAKWTQLEYQGIDKLSPTDADVEYAWAKTSQKIASFLTKGNVKQRGKPMIVQLQATDVEAIKRGDDAPMVRYTAKAAYEKTYGKGV